MYSYQTTSYLWSSRHRNRSLPWNFQMLSLREFIHVTSQENESRYSTQKETMPDQSHIFSVVHGYNSIVFVHTSSLSHWWQLEHSVKTSANYFSSSTNNLSSLILCSSQLRSHWKYKLFGLGGEGGKLISRSREHDCPSTVHSREVWGHAPPGYFGSFCALRNILVHFEAYRIYTQNS